MGVRRTFFTSPLWILTERIFCEKIRVSIFSSSCRIFEPKIFHSMPETVELNQQRRNLHNLCHCGIWLCFHVMLSICSRIIWPHNSHCEIEYHICFKILQILEWNRNVRQRTPPSAHFFAGLWNCCVLDSLRGVLINSADVDFSFQQAERVKLISLHQYECCCTEPNSPLSCLQLLLPQWHKC